MENYDPELAARVWQRVRAPGAQAPESEALAPLIAGEWAGAVAFMRLSRNFKGREAATLRRLSEQAQAHAACLRGIYTLSTGQKCVVQAPPPAQERPEAVLRRCYAQAMQALDEYERRSADREYGPVYTRLAQQKREHCQAVLELIGSIAGK